MATINYNATYKGRIAVTKSTGNVNVRASYSITSAVAFSLKDGDKTSCIMTGNYVNDGSHTWWEVTIQSKSKGWIRSDVFAMATVSSSSNSSSNSSSSNTSSNDSTAQSLMNNLILSDNQVYNSLMRMTALASRDSNAANHMAKNMTTYLAIYNRLVARQKAVKDNANLKTQSVTPSTYTALKSSITNFFSRISGVDQIGAIPILIIIIITVVVTAGTGITLYNLFKPKYDESQVDLKKTDELERALKSLSPTEAAKLEKDLEKQIDDAYNQGKTDGTFGGFGSTIKYLAIGIGGFFLVNMFMNKVKRN